MIHGLRWLAVSLLVACGSAAAPPRSAPPLPPPPATPVLPLPTDLRTLPTMEVLFRLGSDIRIVHAQDGVLWGVERGRLVAMDGATGVARWSSEPLLLADQLYEVGTGCGVAVSFSSTGLRAFALEDGALVWSRPVEAGGLPPLVSRGGEVAGCDVLAIVASDAPDRSGHLIRLDARTGVTVDENACDDCEQLRHAVSDGAGGIALDDGARVLYLPADAPAITVATRVCPIDLDHDARTLACHRLTADGIERVDDAGERVWLLPNAPGTWMPIIAESDAHLLLGGSSVVVDVSPTTGEVRWARTRPLPELPSLGARVRLDGDVAYFSTVVESVAVSLSRAGPPSRDALTVEDDLALTVVELGRQLGNEPYRGFPTGSVEAWGWLQRMLPLVPEDRVALLLHEDDATVLRVLPIVSGDLREAPREAVASLVTRFAPGEPTLEEATWRTAVARALRPPMDAATAERLADHTIAWLTAWAEHRPAWPQACRESDVPCAMRAAIVAARDALDRASIDPAPGQRVHDAIADRWPARRRSCTPGPDDEVLEVALRYLVELEPAPREVAVPDGSCLTLPRLDSRGYVWSVDTEEREPWTPTGVPVWDEAEHRMLSWMWYASPSGGSGGRLWLARLGGTWRVVQRATDHRI